MHYELFLSKHLASAFVRHLTRERNDMCYNRDPYVPSPTSPLRHVWITYSKSLNTRETSCESESSYSDRDIIWLPANIRGPDPLRHEWLAEYMRMMCQLGMAKYSALESKDQAFAWDEDTITKILLQDVYYLHGLVTTSTSSCARK
jgi:hypothetical protein